MIPFTPTPASAPGRAARLWARVQSCFCFEIRPPARFPRACVLVLHPLSSLPLWDPPVKLLNSHNSSSTRRIKDKSPAHEASPVTWFYHELTSLPDPTAWRSRCYLFCPSRPCPSSVGRSQLLAAKSSFTWLGQCVPPSGIHLSPSICSLNTCPNPATRSDSRILFMSPAYSYWKTDRGSRVIILRGTPRCIKSGYILDLLTLQIVMETADIRIKVLWGCRQVTASVEL